MQSLEESFKQMQLERDTALAEVERLKEERDSALALVAEARIELERGPSSLLAQACDTRDVALAEIERLKEASIYSHCINCIALVQSTHGGPVRCATCSKGKGIV